MNSRGKCKIAMIQSMCTPLKSILVSFKLTFLLILFLWRYRFTNWNSFEYFNRDICQCILIILLHIFCNSLTCGKGKIDNICILPRCFIDLEIFHIGEIDWQFNIQLSNFFFLFQSATTFPSLLNIETSGQADISFVYDPTSTVKNILRTILRYHKLELMLNA